MLGRYCMLLLILPYCLHIENIQGIKAGTTSTPEVIEVKSGLPVSAKHFLELNDSTLSSSCLKAVPPLSMLHTA